MITHRSFNNDKPFDRFILEQLAGDELAPGDQEALVAVGFNRLAAWRKNAGNQDEDMNRNEVLTEQTNAVGAVFMGTTWRVPVVTTISSIPSSKATTIACKRSLRLPYSRKHHWPALKHRRPGTPKPSQ